MNNNLYQNLSRQMKFKEVSFDQGLSAQEIYCCDEYKNRERAVGYRGTVK